MSKEITCIVVEDYPRLRELYSRILDYEHDISVVGTASNYRELKDLIRTVIPTVILMDIEMETLKEGILACKELTSLYPAVKIIMLTCHEEESLIQSAFEAGAWDYILKTESSVAIIQSVRDAYKGISSFKGRTANVLRRRFADLGQMKERMLDVTRKLTALTPTERDILKLMLEEKRRKEIAETRYIELSTLKVHVKSILRKLECRRTADVVALIEKSGLKDYLESL
jgi:DNA-binding NarL/FixJ family response regulator